MIIIQLGTNVVFIEKCAVTFDPGPYLKGQSYKRHLKIRLHMLISTLSLTYALMDYHKSKNKNSRITLTLILPTQHTI